MNIHEQIGKNLADARNKAGLTQVESSAIIGLSRASIVNMEKGRQALGMKNMFLFSVMYEVPVTDILKGIDIESNIISPELMQTVKAQHPTALKGVKVAIISAMFKLEPE